MPSIAFGASCEPVTAFAALHKLPPQACTVVDNGAAKLRVCTGETSDALRVEVANVPNSGPIEATHIVTWFNEVARSEPSGAQYTFGGTLFVGPTQALSLRYKDYVRGDSAVSGGFRLPDDKVEVRVGSSEKLGCAVLPLKSDADVEAALAPLYAATR